MFIREVSHSSSVGALPGESWLWKTALRESSTSQRCRSWNSSHVITVHVRGGFYACSRIISGMRSDISRVRRTMKGWGSVSDRR